MCHPRCSTAPRRVPQDAPATGVEPLSVKGGTISQVLEVSDLRTVFHTQDGVVHAVNGVSFHLDQGELLAVVGESGSGKSVAMMSLMQLLPMPPAEIASGRVKFGNQDLVKLGASEIRQVRGARIDTHTPTPSLGTNIVPRSQ